MQHHGSVIELDEYTMREERVRASFLLLVLVRAIEKKKKAFVPRFSCSVRIIRNPTTRKKPYQSSIRYIRIISLSLFFFFLFFLNAFPFCFLFFFFWKRTTKRISSLYSNTSTMYVQRSDYKTLFKKRAHIIAAKFR